MSHAAALQCDGCGAIATVTVPRGDRVNRIPFGWRRLRITRCTPAGALSATVDVCSPNCASRAVLDNLSDEEMTALTAVIA